jgi:hypothetical protein
MAKVTQLSRIIVRMIASKTLQQYNHSTTHLTFLAWCKVLQAHSLKHSRRCPGISCLSRHTHSTLAGSRVEVIRAKKIIVFLLFEKPIKNIQLNSDTIMPSRNYSREWRSFWSSPVVGMARRLLARCSCRRSWAGSMLRRVYKKWLVEH